MREENGVATLSFDFLQRAFLDRRLRGFVGGVDHALARRPRVLVLTGSGDCWSNGLHLGVIEAAASPADESWRNINAMNDLVERIARAEMSGRSRPCAAMPAPAASSCRSPLTKCGWAKT